MKQDLHRIFRFVICILFTCFSLWNLNGQIIYSEEEVKEEEVFEFIDVSDELFGLQNDVKTVYKLGFTGAGNKASVFGGLEQKIGESVSLDFGLGLSSQNHTLREVLFEAIVATSGFEVFVEPRYFFGMKKGILDGSRASNVTGRYLGFNGSYIFSFTNSQLSAYSLTSKFGIQTTYLNRGLFDANLFAGITTSETLGASFSMGTQIKIGFGWIKGREGDSQAVICDAFRCFEENLSWTKLDILNLPRVSGNQFGFFFKPRLKITRERKIKESVSNSLNMAGYIGYNQATFSDDFINLAYTDSIPDFFQPKSQYFNIGTEISLRHYLSKKKKIAQGKTSNNLNGLYLEALFFIEVGYTSFTDNKFVKFSGLGATSGTEVHFGMQQRILDKFFVDFFLNVSTFTSTFGFQESKDSREQFNLSLGYTF